MPMKNKVLKFAESALVILVLLALATIPLTAEIPRTNLLKRLPIHDVPVASSFLPIAEYWASFLTSFVESISVYPYLMPLISIVVTLIKVSLHSFSQATDTSILQRLITGAMVTVDITVTCIWTYTKLLTTYLLMYSFFIAMYLAVFSCGLAIFLYIPVIETLLVEPRVVLVCLSVLSVFLPFMPIESDDRTLSEVIREYSQK